jgi:hypothetical protein
MEDVEYLHGASAPGAPWLLLCRGSDALFAGEPISHDDPYMDMIRMYRHAADTAMSIEDAAGIAHSPPARRLESMERCRKAGGRPTEVLGTPS